MNAGTSVSSESAQPAARIDDTQETVSEFLDKIATAQGAGEESIETTPEIIAHFNRRGLNGADYFFYAGIKVYPYGKKEEIEARESQPIAERLHGKDEGRVIS